MTNDSILPHIRSCMIMSTSHCTQTILYLHLVQCSFLRWSIGVKVLWWRCKTKTSRGTAKQLHSSRDAIPRPWKSQQHKFKAGGECDRTYFSIRCWRRDEPLLVCVCLLYKNRRRSRTFSALILSSYISSGLFSLRSTIKDFTSTRCMSHIHFSQLQSSLEEQHGLKKVPFLHLEPYCLRHLQ